MKPRRLKVRALTGIVAAAATALPYAASAADYLSSLEGEVVQTTGTQDEIAARANSCIARTLSPGVQGGQLIISNSGGTIVSNNVIAYTAGLITWTVRSRLVLEAREGRFRVTQSNIERFNDWNASWQPIGKHFGSGWRAAEDALKRVSLTLEQCTASTESKEDW